jgi:hypothetical protein
MKAKVINTAARLVNDCQFLSSCAVKVAAGHEVAIAFKPKEGQKNSDGFSATLVLSQEDAAALQGIFNRAFKRVETDAVTLGVEF